MKKITLSPEHKDQMKTFLKDKFPIPKKGQKAAAFLKEAAEDMAKAKLVEMFSKPEAFKIERDGNMLYILDNIYDVWPDDEDRGKSGKLIAEIVQGKIRDYSRIHDEYEYKKAEYKYAGAGVMRLLFYFEKQINY